ncbi:Insoluble domain protein [Prescottella defluvii]|uniref:hypothetical protein n=1 Tax=Prescottella defluvii TaxID=1323361 RepID=UPI0039EAF725
MGKHRKSRVRTFARAAMVPSAAAAVVVAASGAASAAPDQLPSQGGVTSAPQTQGGVTSGPSTQGGVTSTPAQPEPVYWVEPPAQYQNIEYQPLDNYDYDTNTYNAPANYYVAPVQFEELHLPTYVEPTAPIIAPRETLRVGTYHAPQPNWITDADLARTNNTSAVIEAEVSTFWRSLGVETTRANRLAAAQFGMGAVGAVTTAVAWGVPAALAGGTYGGTITAFNPPALVSGIGWVPGGVFGTAVGAAVAGIPVALAGAVVGGMAGVQAGTAVGAGDLGEPQDLPISDIDHSAIVAQTQETLAQWEATPVGGVAASAVRDAVDAAPGIDRQARDFVSAQPGGTQILDQIDGAINAFVVESSLGVATNMISGAVGDGIQA